MRESGKNIFKFNYANKILLFPLFYSFFGAKLSKENEKKEHGEKFTQF